MVYFACNLKVLGIKKGMVINMNLAGLWEFCLDKEKTGIDRGLFHQSLEDTIVLPTTTSEALKGKDSGAREIGCLTDPYLFEGYAWYSKIIEIETAEATGSEEKSAETEAIRTETKEAIKTVKTEEKTEAYKADYHKQYQFIMERTRISHVWVDGIKVGSQDSLCTSHKYDLTQYLTKGRHRLTVMIDNTSYKTRGGHMTSPDTQTNWNGILGDILLKETVGASIAKVVVTPSRINKEAYVFMEVSGKKAGKYQVTVICECKCLKIQEQPEDSLSLSNLPAQPEFEMVGVLFPKTFDIYIEKENTKQTISFEYSLGKTVFEWDEYQPNIYTMRINIADGDTEADTVVTQFGLRDFTSQGLDLQCNGKSIFLRGKHDGLIFPMTGYAPMGLNDWLKVFTTVKSYGINHYRFHTCCPPKAAFLAADYLGIYMEPELPFWGTVAEKGEEYYNGEEREYLVNEGFRILEEFGNYPSFVAFSMGNELWGSKSAINSIMGGFKKKDRRHMYTQGSNNHQFVPSILENDDFFSGVRFSKNRLFRGSYAMCDAPQGHVQMDMPNTLVNYDEMILPKEIMEETEANKGGTIQIQYGTGVKEVKAEEGEEIIIPNVPVISHEIGQYETSPNFDEIKKYTGVLKARNFQVFQERLEEKGLFGYWKDYFMASGHLAGECYQRELESALNSRLLSGFQILDLQDFSGQGTALIGILDAFLDNKGTVSRREWTSYCSDAVLLPCFEKFVYTSGEIFHAKVKLRYYNPKIISARKVAIYLNEKEVDSFEFQEINSRGLFELGEMELIIPQVTEPSKMKIEFEIVGENIRKSYDLWVYPPLSMKAVVDNYNKSEDLIIITDLRVTLDALSAGKKVLYFPDKANSNSIAGTYATDFWCYPMFRSISESVNRAIPVGTLGLLIDNKHPALKNFNTDFYSSPQWYHIVNASSSTILDHIKIKPIVRTIDNFERNHNLGLLYEMNVESGKLLVCTANLLALSDKVEAAWLLKSLLDYMDSTVFFPEEKISIDELKKCFEIK